MAGKSRAGGGGGGGGAAGVPIISSEASAGIIARDAGITIRDARTATASESGRTVTIGSGNSQISLNANGQQSVQNGINARGGRGSMVVMQLGPGPGGRGGRAVRLNSQAMRRTNEAITRARRNRTGRGGVTQE